MQFRFYDLTKDEFVIFPFQDTQLFLSMNIGDFINKDGVVYRIAQKVYVTEGPITLIEYKMWRY